MAFAIYFENIDVHDYYLIDLLIANIVFIDYK